MPKIYWTKLVDKYIVWWIAIWPFNWISQFVDCSLSILVWWQPMNWTMSRKWRAKGEWLPSSRFGSEFWDYISSSIQLPTPLSRFDKPMEFWRFTLYFRSCIVVCWKTVEFCQEWIWSWPRFLQFVTRGTKSEWIHLVSYFFRESAQRSLARHPTVVIECGVLSTMAPAPNPILPSDTCKLLLFLFCSISTVGNQIIHLSDTTSFAMSIRMDKSAREICELASARLRYTQSDKALCLVEVKSNGGWILRAAYLLTFEFVQKRLSSR